MKRSGSLRRRRFPFGVFLSRKRCCNLCNTAKCLPRFDKGNRLPRDRLSGTSNDLASACCLCVTEMPRFSPTVVRNPEREKLKKGCLYPPALLSVDVFGLGVVGNFGIATATAVVMTQFSTNNCVVLDHHFEPRPT